MTTEQVKQELVKRYDYLYENVEFLLAQYISEPEIYVEEDECLMQMTEEFLFSENTMESSFIYILIEDMKKDPKYRKRAQRSIELVKKKNEETKYFKIRLDMYNLLHKYERYLKEQSGDLDNKENKLRVLDEYFRILRYQNDGKIYTSGCDLTLHDCPSGISISLKKMEPTRPQGDIGITRNKFIDGVVNAPYHEYNWSLFTEEEKQEIYLRHHTDLPYYFYTICDLEEEYIETMIDSRLQRPENTKPCNESFKIDESQIFVNPNDALYRYYQLCPHCGYIVNISKEIIPENVKQRIEERCSQDLYLFRKNILRSELFALENKGLKKKLK